MGHIKKQEVRHSLRGVSSEDGGLHSGAIGHSLVRVDRLVQLLAVEEVLEQLLDLGDPSGASDEDDVIDGALVHLGIPHGLLHGLESSLEEVRAELLKPGPGDGGVEIDTLEQRVNLNVGLGRGRQGPLGSLASSPQPPKSSLVPLDVLLVLTLELVDEVVDHPVVEVLNSQMGVTSGGLDLKDALLNGQDGHIEGAASEIEDENVALSGSFLLVQTVGDGGSGGLVDDTENIETSDDTRVLGGLPLGVIEVGGDGDDSVLNLSAEVSLSSLLHFGEDHGGDLLWGESLGLVLVLALELGLGGILDNSEGPVLHVGLDSRVIKLTSDQSLGVEDGVGGVDGDLVLGGVSDEPLGVGEGDIGGSGPVTLVIGDDLDLAMLEHAHTGVGGAQINSNCLLLGHFV